MPVETEYLVQDQPQVIAGSSDHLKATALRAYRDQSEHCVSDQSIIELLPLVPRIANRVITYLKPPLSLEDLIAAGTLGLVKAAKDYDPARQAEFKTYAYIRIRGAILDELKKWSFLPHDHTKQLAQVFRAAQNFKQQNGTDPADEQLAEQLNISLDELYKILEDARARQFLSIQGAGETAAPLSDFLVCHTARNPQQQAQRGELVEKLTETIMSLPEKKRQVIILYYQRNLTMKQIAELMQITESRVSQLHSSAVFNLSVKLRQFKDAG